MKRSKRNKHTDAGAQGLEKIIAFMFTMLKGKADHASHAFD
jgi:hypothetical protein